MTNILLSELQLMRFRELAEDTLGLQICLGIEDL
jgi:hypothetical protein